ncbi:inositol monophosphatase family protein [Dietzia sp. CH92]|uniref:inositol monophosphatase family protein n=1 Tax=Dietzia sp. CH92 TaxID=3051823 RepID=UPI0028D29E6F|nr:inositol monophosphatase family protein [Dietzia sp. CH92]
MTHQGAVPVPGGTGVEFIDGLRELAEGLAISGGDVARRMLAEFDLQGLDSRSKSSETDPVTVIDTSVEEHLRREIASRRPGDWVLGEEGGEAAGDSAHSGAGPRVRWIVDPVDGTVNLLYGIPFTAVSVAAEVDGVVVAGAVHNIVTRETWTAGRGRGASLRGTDGSARTLRVSGCADLSLALVGTGFAYDAGMRAEQGGVVAALLPRVRDIRRCGSAALDLCMLATGRLDAYYERGLRPWDHAAGALVAAEAGAVVSVSDDDAVPTVAAAPGVAGEFLAAIGEPADRARGQQSTERAASSSEEMG